MFLSMPTRVLFTGNIYTLIILIQIWNPLNYILTGCYYGFEDFLCYSQYMAAGIVFRLI